MKPNKTPVKNAAALPVKTGFLPSNPAMQSIWLLALALLAGWPLFLPGLIASHDGGEHLLRLAQMAKVFHDGQYLARWLPDAMGGYGLPVFIFIPPLGYWGGLAFIWLGCNTVWAFKLIMFLTLPLSGLAMLFCLRRYLKPEAAWLGAAAYLLAPYRFVDLYVRGALPESSAFIFLPLVFLFTHQCLTQKSLKSVLAFALAFAGLLLTHNLTALIILPLLFIYAGYWLVWEKPAGWGLAWLGAVLLALGMAAFYWVPALAEKKYALLQSLQGAEFFNFKDHFVYAVQFFSGFWGYGYSVAGSNDGMSFQIGVLQILGFGLAAFFLRQSRLPARRFLYFFLSLFVLAVFMAGPWSGWLWASLPLLPLIQFPWRFLMLAVLSGAVLLGALLEFAGENKKWGLAIGLGMLIWPAAQLLVANALDSRENPLSGMQLAISALTGLVLLGYWAAKEFAPRLLGLLALAMLIGVSLTWWNLPLHRYLLGAPAAADSAEEQFSPGNIAQSLQPFDVTLQLVPKTVQQVPTQPAAAALEFFQGKGTLQEITKHSDHWQAEISADTAADVQINLFYFPGWALSLDGSPVVPVLDAQGRMHVKVEAGSHRLNLVFQDTPVRKAADIFSAFSWLIAVVLAGVIYYKRRTKPYSAQKA